MIKFSSPKGQLAIFSAMTIGAYGSFTIPLLISMYTENLNMSVSQAGNIGAIELVCIGISQIIMGALLPKIKSIRACALLFTAISIVAQLITPYMSSFPLLALDRLIVGFSTGATYACALVGAVTFPDPDRIIARGSAFYCAVFAVVLWFLPTVFTKFGPVGGCGYIAATCIPWLLFILWLPVPEKVEGEEGAKLDISGIRLIVLILALASVLVSLVLQLPWIFSDVIGSNINLSDAQMGTAYSLSSVAMIVGGLFADYLGSTRIKKITILVLGAFATGITCLGMTTATTYIVFLASMLLASAVYYVAYPYALGYAASLDHTGSLSAIVGGMFDTTAALSPIFGGFLLSNYGPYVMGWICLGVSSCAGVFYVILGAVSRIQGKAVY